MAGSLVQGVIDFVDGHHVRGWFRLSQEAPFDAWLMFDGENIPVKLERVADKALRWKFHALSPERMAANDFLSGRAALRLTIGDDSCDLPLWEPLRVSASVERLTEQTVPRFLKGLSEAQRALLRAQIEAMDGRAPVRERRSGPNRALFGNAEFSVIAGSELVIMEMVEALSGLGWACDITAWSIDDPMRDIARKAGATLIESPLDIKAFQYDLVWLNNRLEAVFDYSLSPDDSPRTLFVFAHLDRSWSFAQPGVVLEPLLGHAFIVTEAARIDSLREYGIPEKGVSIFRNPAPRAFELPAAPVSRGLQRLLLVTNHAPKEVTEAVPLLRARGVDVIWWGSGGDIRQRRLLPADLTEADAVLTIGKTVPYALRARRPVFVYDHFGGPGWLNEGNFVSAAGRNFSGLCCERRLDAAAICEEIVAGFEQARQAAISFHGDVLAPYRLEDEVGQLLALHATAPSPAEHRARIDRHLPALRGERQLALTAGTYFRHAIRAHRASRNERPAGSSAS